MEGLLYSPKVSHPRSEYNFCTKQGENLGLQFKLHLYTCDMHMAF
jgi:hypothetical protein